MRIACLLIHNLAVQVAVAGDRSLADRPLVIGGFPFEAKPVYDASPRATACGIEVGMPLREACALCPEAEFMPAEQGRYEPIFEQVACVLEKFSPVVDIEKPGCAYIDIKGVRDEINLCRDILSSISVETGLSACLGVSGGKFFSHVAAFTSKPDIPVILSPGQERDFVAPFPVDFLPCSDESKKRLGLLGIYFIGELTRFSREALVAQFGAEGVLMHDLSHGSDRSPLVPRAKPEIVADSIILDAPSASSIEILQACEILLAKMLSRVSERGKLCREVTVTLGFESGSAEEGRLILKEPTATGKAIMDRLRDWLETVKSPSPAADVKLALSLTREQGKKLPLWPDRQGAEERLMKAAQELKLRFGYQPIKKSRPVSPQPILPERRFTLTDALE